MLVMLVPKVLHILLLVVSTRVSSDESKMENNANQYLTSSSLIITFSRVTQLRTTALRVYAVRGYRILCDADGVGFVYIFGYRRRRYLQQPNYCSVLLHSVELAAEECLAMSTYQPSLTPLVLVTTKE